jgi:D-3-phosphoglycerate dehydrogenase
MAPTVVIAYPGFGDIRIEEDMLSTIDANVSHVANLDTPSSREVAAQADALMVTLQPVPAELIATMERCRIISRVGTGLDAIDIDAATKHGIWVTYVPDYAVDEVSTHAIASLLAHARGFPRLLESTRRGEWGNKVVAPIRRLQGQTLGLLGFGRIGRAVGSKARGLGLEVVVHDPYLDSLPPESSDAQLVDWETLLRTSDYISLHVPLTEGTRHIINSKSLSLMKPTAFLINTARGALIDEDALLEAVRSGQIAGAALDVLSAEPPPVDHPLLHEERVWITPHSAWYSEESMEDMRTRGAEEVVRVLQGQKPRSPVNQIN